MHSLSLSAEFPSAPAVASDTTDGTAKVTKPQKERRRALVVPREHGAWGMLLVPLVAGAAVGVMVGGRIAPVLLLTMAVLALFWLRTPAESWLGTGAVRAQTPEERRHVRNFALPLATIAAVSLIALFWQGKGRELLVLGMIAGIAFAAQIVLKKMGRATRMVAEVVGALALTSTAPAAYYVATGRLDAKAWSLWLLNWLFAADQVHFVWLRIRGARAAGWSEKLLVGWTFLVGQVLLVGILAFACHLGWLTALTLIAFAPVLFRGCAWFAKKPQPIVVRRLGWTELTHALVFGILLIAGFSLL
ncbi:MAG: YwiC-like family protein [Acidobacteriia bacterium]|nr:YwiC-like family protein [Terriglobia bacterium]